MRLCRIRMFRRIVCCEDDRMTEHGRLKNMIKRSKAFRILICMIIMIVMSAGALTVPCMAEDSIDIGAISGFGNDFSIDDEGKFEISGAMVSNGLLYNISTEDGGIRAWCKKSKGRLWKDKELKDLLNDKTTFFYEKVSGTPDSAEFSNKVEFARPNGKTW